MSIGREANSAIFFSLTISAFLFILIINVFSSTKNVALADKKCILNHRKRGSRKNPAFAQEDFRFSSGEAK